MKEIRIGGNLVSVPNGYIKAESAYTIKESSVFTALAKLGASTALETARTAVLEKRIEFYDLYLVGKVQIGIRNLFKKEKSIFEKVMRWLWDGQWIQ